LILSSVTIDPGCDLQVLVEHPEEYLQHIKQRLHEKQGIPVEQQRLVFSGREAEPLEEPRTPSSQQLAAEDILASLSEWQV
jgi:hypothetical protein